MHGVVLLVVTALYLIVQLLQALLQVLPVAHLHQVHQVHPLHHQVLQAVHLQDKLIVQDQHVMELKLAAVMGILKIVRLAQ